MVTKKVTLAVTHRSVARAGFDLREVRRLLERMQGYNSETTTAGFVRSHPSNRERVAALDEMIAEFERRRAQGETPIVQ